ncbi:hypothetical protein K501DRAFT_255522 [Backusella circina FSU 941]|nr:hypothetical protein K501DRAFT_255522 [Backusella circina FSU 941]
MGCCSSTPEREAQSEAISPQQQQQQQQQESHETAGNIKKKHGIEVTITRPSTSSLNSQHAEKLPPAQEDIDNEKQQQQSTKTWPIFVRLSSNGQDIKIEAPIEAPYLTIAGLQQYLIPHLNSASVKLIYLGRILTNKQTIVPTVTDEDVPLPPPKNNIIQIQKCGVIQAMVVS